MKVNKLVLGGEQRFLGSLDNGLRCVCVIPWVNIGAILVYPPLKTLWCQTQWNVCFKASMVGTRGTSCTLLITASLLLICRREKLFCVLLLVTRRVEGKSLGAQSAHLRSAGLGYALSGISKANLRQFFCCEIHRMKRIRNFQVFFSFQHWHQSLLMPLPIL